MSFADEYIEIFDVPGYVSSVGRARHSNRQNINVTPCPICGDNRRHKFYVNISGGKDNGRWNSYCCHDQGGLVELVMAVESMSRPEAVAFIRAEVDGEDEDRVIPLTSSTIAEPSVARSEAPGCAFPENLYNVSENDEIVHHGRPVALTERGITQALIDKYDLRRTFAPTAFKGRLRPEFNNRLIIPIPASDGQSFLSWQGRDLTGQSENKYVFPPGDQSASTLYGWQVAQHQKMVILVEGVFHKWAFDNLADIIDNQVFGDGCVATFGKKLSAAQEDLLMSSPAIENVVIAWDLDAATQISKVAQRLNGRKRLFIMPASADGRDLDELTYKEMISLFCAIEPYSFALAARLNASGMIRK